ncbi:hypothetical protein MSI_20340 [Treponema sp. JC4]|jgi:hypothetical protein|uniref:hypothetical protein n=1 Tax=Treponema sp. JC4 TaxID=1124982 RepID=UPI00025B0584|nr:hypothetical protein [Treponema sp. JC4]EID84486.1 hypothetical protein MSI_20340 [Treponema sp. JC4]
MLEIELNELPELMHKGKISRNQALNYLAEFIFRNYPIFGLHKYDEDFREEIILDFLEKGGIVIDSYNKSIGNFFPYFYSQVTSMISKNLKKRARRSIDEFTTIHEEYKKILMNKNKYEAYKPLLCADVTPPYARKMVSVEDLRSALQGYTSKRDKVLIILILKYVLYFDEKSLYSISKSLGLNYSIIMEGRRFCKNSLKNKIEKRKSLAESRNKSYFYKNRYQTQINYYSQFQEGFDPSKIELLQKYQHHSHAWLTKNHQLEHQTSHLVTSNALIASLLGICERQVRYYLSCADNYKNLFKDL